MLHVVQLRNGTPLGTYVGYRVQSASYPGHCTSRPHTQVITQVGLIPRSSHKSVSYPGHYTSRSHTQVIVQVGLIPRSSHKSASYPGHHTSQSHTQVITLVGLIPRSSHKSVSYPGHHTSRPHNLVITPAINLGVSLVRTGLIYSPLPTLVVVTVCHCMHSFCSTFGY